MRIKKFFLAALKVFVYGIFYPFFLQIFFMGEYTTYYRLKFSHDSPQAASFYRDHHFDNLGFIILAYLLFCIFFFSIKRYNWRKWIVIAFLLLPALFFVIDYLYRWDWYKGLFFSMFYSVINSTYYLLFGVFFIAFLLMERKTTLKAVFRGIIAISGQIFVVCGMVIFSLVYFYQKMGL